MLVGVNEETTCERPPQSQRHIFKYPHVCDSFMAANISHILFVINDCYLMNVYTSLHTDFQGCV